MLHTHNNTMKKKNKFDTFYESIMNESRRTPEETTRLQRNLERYRYLMSAQEQGEGDYFDWDEFEDYSDYEDEIEALEKEAEANGYLDQLERYVDSDADHERNATHLNNDPLKQKAYQVKKNRFKKDGKLNKQDTDTMKKGLKEPWSDRYNTSHSVKGMKKPNLPEDAEGAMEGKTMTVSLNNNELLKLEDKYKCNREVLNLALEYSLAQYKEHIDYNLHDEVQDAGMDVGKEAGVEDAESPMDATANITGEINGNGRMAAEAITNIFALVEDEGQEMLDKQAAEKLEDIIELASNALRELNNRLD